MFERLGGSDWVACKNAEDPCTACTAPSEYHQILCRIFKKELHPSRLRRRNLQDDADPSAWDGELYELRIVTMKLRNIGLKGILPLPLLAGFGALEELDLSSDEGSEHANQITATSDREGIKTVGCLNLQTCYSETLSCEFGSSGTSLCDEGHDYDDPTLLIVGGAIGGVFLLAVSLSAVVVLKRRKSNSHSNQRVSKYKPAQGAPQSRKRQVKEQAARRDTAYSPNPVFFRERRRGPEVGYVDPTKKKGVLKESKYTKNTPQRRRSTVKDQFKNWKDRWGNVFAQHDDSEEEEMASESSSDDYTSDSSTNVAQAFKFGRKKKKHSKSSVTWGRASGTSGDRTSGTSGMSESSGTVIVARLPESDDEASMPSHRNNGTGASIEFHDQFAVPFNEDDDL